MTALLPPILIHFLSICVSLVVLSILVHIVSYFYDPHNLRRYPGPFLAGFTDLWLAKHAKDGKRSLVVHEMHKKFGPILRIAPNHISISSPIGLNLVYAHGNAALKSNFYDAFVSIRRGIFNTRDRAEHCRKRKLVSHVFSQKNVVEFEPHIQAYVARLIARWEGFMDLGPSRHGPEGEDWKVDEKGLLWVDFVPWMNYLAFDIIGDLAFGSPFGMIDAGKDEALAPTASSAQDLRRTLDSGCSQKIPYKKIPAIKILTGRGDYSSSMGVLPVWMRPFARRFLPWFKKGEQDVDNLAGIAVVAVMTRLAKEKYTIDGGDEEEGGISGEERVDLLSKLRHGKDDQGNRLSLEELTAEALTLLIAGSDTLSNSMCAILYYIAANPHTQQTLSHELQAHLDPPPAIVPHQALRSLPYLSAVIYESLRLHSTSSLGLPRVVPAGGLTILNEYFEEGTIVSVPSYSIHRDESTWGANVEEFRPERWFEGGVDGRRKREGAWNGFSLGPRGCVGKNLAMLELQIVVASLVHQYEIILEDSMAPFETREGFLRKPVTCRVGLKKRD